MAEPHTIATWSAAEGPSILVQRLADASVMISVVDDDGDAVQVAVPADAWFVLARKFFESRSRLSMTVELGRLH